MLQCTSSLKMRMDQERRSIWIIINIIVKDCMNIFLPREYPDMPSKRLFQLPPPVYFTWHYFHLKFVCMCREKSYLKWIMSFLVFASRQRDTISTACKWSDTSDPLVKCKVWHAVTLPRGGAEAGGGGGGVARPRQAGQEEDDALLRRQEVQEQDRDCLRGAATWRRGRAQVGSTKFHDI